MAAKLKTIEAPPGWEPHFKLDLAIAGPGAFRQIQDALKPWALENPATISWETGWYNVNPYMSEDLLKRSIVAGNRNVSFEGVKSYARDMLDGEWIMTGETGIIDENGKVRDFQHRAYASYFSGASFPVFVVAGVEAHPDLSSRINSGIPRSAADALFMAGCGTVSAQVATAISIAHRYDNNAYKVNSTERIRGLTNTEVVDYWKEHLSLKDAAHTVLGTHKKAVDVIHHKGVAVFVAWNIIERFGTEALDQFMSPLGNGANLAEADPVLALRSRLAKLKEDCSSNTAERMAYVIKAFNMHRLGQTVRLTGRNSGLILATNEAFPRFEEVEVMEEAAE